MHVFTSNNNIILMDEFGYIQVIKADTVANHVHLTDGWVDWIISFLFNIYI